VLEALEAGEETSEINLFLGFHPQKQDHCAPYCFLQKYDFDTFTPVHNFPSLSLNIDSQNLKLANQNHVFKFIAVTPLALNVYFASNAKFTLMSIPTYLQTYLAHETSTFVVELGPIEEHKHLCLAKF